MLRSEAFRVFIGVLLGGLVCLFGLPSLTHAQDPGIQDSMIIGPLNRAPILAGLNTQIVVPVYLRTDDSVTFIHVPVATDNDYIATRDGGVFFPPLTLWDDKIFLAPDLNSPSIGHSSQSFVGFAYLVDPRDPQNFLYTNNQWVHIADFRMTTTNDIAVLGDTTFIAEGLNPANQHLVMGLPDGLSEVHPAVVWGSIYFPPNTAPYFISPDSGTFPVNEQFGASFVVTAADPDTDAMVLTTTFEPLNYTFTQIQNIPGRVSFLFNWVPEPGAAGTYPLTFTVNDGNGGVIERHLTLVVSPAGLSIGDMTTLPGATISLPISLENQGSSSAVGGFEILVSWNPEALTLTGVTRGGRLGTYEYFHVRYDDSGPGSARITGIADIRNGNVSPPLHPGSGPIFFLEMAVSPDENLIGVDLPVAFLNLDENDNTVADSTGYLLVHPNLTNGLISVMGPHEVLTGDINLNGFAYETGDVVLLVNHLTNPTAFPFNSIQREASDVNSDGIPETVADLVYLLNVFNGNIQEPKLEPVDNLMTIMIAADGTITKFRANSQIEMGAILMKIAHRPGTILTPTTDGEFTLACYDDGSVLTVLAYMPDGGGIAGDIPIFSLDAIQSSLVVGELSASDAAGYLMDTAFRAEDAIPTFYELAQNYPNPFNATTRIVFGLPEASDISLEVYSITGQKVCSLMNGHLEAGRYNINWNGKDATGEPVSSGVYFYRLQTGTETKTLKMTMLK